MIIPMANPIRPAITALTTNSPPSQNANCKIMARIRYAETMTFSPTYVVIQPNVNRLTVIPIQKLEATSDEAEDVPCRTVVIKVKSHPPIVTSEPT